MATWSKIALNSELPEVMGSSNSYEAGLVKAGSSSHGNTYLRKDGAWGTPTNTNTNQLTTFTLQADGGGGGTVQQGSTVDIAGGTNVSTNYSANTVTVAVDDSPTFTGQVNVTSGALVVTGADDTAAYVYIQADLNANNADNWRLSAETDGMFDIQARESGSWESVVEWAGSDKALYAKGNIYMSGTTLSLAGNASTDSYVRFDGTGGDTYFHYNANDVIDVYTGGDIAMRIKDDDVEFNGAVVVAGGDNNAPGLQLDGPDDGFFHDTADPGQGIKVMVNNANEFLFANGGDFHADADVIGYSTTISDERVKDNIKTLDSALDKVKNLRGVEYIWNKGSREGQKDIGVIAQEVDMVIPEIVKEKSMPLMDKSGERYLTVDYEKLTAVLIEGMKEQQKQIDKLTETISGIIE